jgi:GAF domain/ANTAR domain
MSAGDSMSDDVRRLVAREVSRPGDQPLVAGSLQRLCRAAVGMLPASGVGVSVMSDRGLPVTTAASDAASARMEELQFTVGEGPCLDAYTSRRPVLTPDLVAAGHTRWPGYAPAAHEQGVGAVFAFTLQVGAARLGVLDVYRGHPGVLSQRAMSQALTFAELAVEILLDAQASAVEDAASPTFDDALDIGYELYQAQGMVMVQLGVTLGEAMSRLRAHAFANDQRLGEVAGDVVDRRLVLEADGPDGDGLAREEG